MTPGFGPFLAVEWTPALLLVPLAVWGLRRHSRRRAERLAEFIGPRVAELAPEQRPVRRQFRRAVFVGGLLLALVALLQPSWGETTRPVEQRGVDVLVCVDVSRSMLARDAAPDRLEAARAAVAELVAHAEGDRFGLVAFAGEARLVVPLTHDAGTLLALLDRIDPYTVERGGTDLAAALDMAGRALVGRTGEHEAVVLVTDGEDHEGRGLRAAERLAAQGVTVHCVGLGSERGAKIPVTAAGPGSGAGEMFLRDATGADVVSALRPASLRRIAAATGGAFVAASDVESPLVILYEDHIAPLARRAYQEEQRRHRTPRFQWPLALAFALWILDLCITDRQS